MINRSYTYRVADRIFPGPAILLFYRKLTYFPLTEQSPRADSKLPHPLIHAGSEPDFARRRTAARLPSFVRRKREHNLFVLLF